MSARTEATSPRRAGTPSGKVVLVGFMCAGKSTVGRRLAELTSAPFQDADALLEQELGEPIARFFERAGEPAFREHEQALVLRLLDTPGPGVLALGGGAVESERVRERLAGELCLHLEVDAATAWERARGSGRPLARDRDAFTALWSRRLPLYESVARASLLWAETASGGYPVYVGEGVLSHAGALWPRGAGRPFVVADRRVAELHGETLEGALAALGPGATVTVEPGEEHKTIAEAERVLRALAGAGMQRGDGVLALGGGVVGDLAGFCAAVYQRGVAHVQAPTTVVAQVDSAYGGKTGVDLPEAKNYVGAFHQPGAVLTDPGTLTTLPKAELAAGFAEIVKTALLAGGDLWDDVLELPPLADALASEPARVRRVIEGCARTKLAVVREDELDRGARAALNLGHTFAHALEAATGYTRHRHGEAVALGLLVALRLSERRAGLARDVRERVVELLRHQGLADRFDGPPTDALLNAMGLDKKRAGERRNLVLLRAPGDPALGCEVPDAELEEAIDELRGVREGDGAPGAGVSGRAGQAGGVLG